MNFNAVVKALCKQTADDLFLLNWQIYSLCAAGTQHSLQLLSAFRQRLYIDGIEMHCGIRVLLCSLLMSALH